MRCVTQIIFSWIINTRQCLQQYDIYGTYTFITEWILSKIIKFTYISNYTESFSLKICLCGNLVTESNV